MSINVIYDNQTSIGFDLIEVKLDYDTVAETVGVTVSGPSDQGTPKSVTLKLTQISNGKVIATVNCDQFQSGGQNDGQRHILAGPGATGLDTAGKGLPTAPVAPAVISRVSPAPGATLQVDYTLA